MYFITLLHAMTPGVHFEAKRIKILGLFMHGFSTGVLVLSPLFGFQP